MKIRFPLLSAALACTLAGCASLAGLFVSKPEVKFESVEFKNSTLSEATLLFRLRVDNPNTFAFTVNRLDYRVRVNEQDVTDGSLEQEIKVPPKDGTSVEIPVRLRYLDLFRSLAEMIRAESSRYQLEAVAHTGPFKIPLKHDGEVKMPRPGSGLF